MPRMGTRQFHKRLREGGLACILLMAAAGPGAWAGPKEQSTANAGAAPSAAPPSTAAQGTPAQPGSAPAGASEPAVPERLTEADVMSVVLAQKPQIIQCALEQKKQAPEVKGRLIMRWNVQPDGKALDVACATPELCTTYIASCLTQLIQAWTFPRHQKPTGPVSFPFTF
jgi:hypothetical protein